MAAHSAAATPDTQPLMRAGSALGKANGRPHAGEAESEHDVEADPEHLDDLDHLDDPESDTTSPDLDAARPSRFVWLLTLAAGLSGLLFGYDTGVISSTLVTIRGDLGAPLSTADKSLITSATAAAALAASPAAGWLADAVGRRPVIFAASLLFVAGALAQAAAGSVAAMAAGRAAVGLGVGAASFVVPLYIGELAPRTWRGRLVTVSVLFITAGQVLAYVVGWLLAGLPGGWRWMVGLGAAPAVLQCALLVRMPETARWLAKAGRRAEAARVLRRVYGAGVDEDDGEHGHDPDSHHSGPDIVARMLRTIERSIADETAHATTASPEHAKHASPFFELFAVPRNRRALAIACLLQAGQQLVGFNSLMYYSATIFARVGFRSPTLAALAVALTNFVFTVVAFGAIDYIGRRRMLLWSVPGMAAGLALSAAAFGFLGDVRGPDVGTADKTHAPWAPALLVAALVLYVAAYALGLGNVPWQQSELFPLRVRSAGASLSTAANWLANTVVGLSFLPMMDLLTPAVTFGVYAVVCMATWAAIYACYPETAGLSLEDIGQVLDRGFGPAAARVRPRPRPPA